MKKILTRSNAFAAFDWPLNYNNIRQQFIQIHERQQEQYPAWNTKATRQKVIATYWQREVPRHFLFLFSSALSVYFLVQTPHVPDRLELLVIGLTAAFAYFIFRNTHYRPFFKDDFLPKLETVIAEYEGGEWVQLEKCRKQQMPVFSLVPLFHVFDKANRLNFLQSNDRVAKVLNRLYGVDERGLKTNLTFLSIKPEPLSPKKLTTKRKEFEEAYQFLEELQFTEGKKILQELELKLLSGQK